MIIQVDLKCGRCNRWLTYVQETDRETGVRTARVMVCQPCVDEMVEKALDIHKPLQCPICKRLFRNRAGWAIHLAWCKCKHCKNWQPRTYCYRICAIGKGARIDSEDCVAPPKDCAGFVRKGA